MPEIKHTPGPWTIDKFYYDGDYLLSVCAKEKGIVDVTNADPEDAKLIAAAPKMYETLKKIARMNICDSAFLAPNAAKKVLEEMEGGNAPD